MPFKKGNNLGKGRINGSQNKDKLELIEMIQEKFPNYHPLKALAEIANGNGKDDLKLQAHKEICKYIAPQLKSIDISGTLKQDVIIDYPTSED